jgi:streptomycin 6-kinase
MQDPVFAPYVIRWDLTPDSAPIATPTARLLPVRYADTLAMLKVFTRDEAKQGTSLLAWWKGEGAARVYEFHDDAMLMERATGDRSLLDYACNGRDDDATRILCDAIKSLHAPRGKPVPPLVSLDVWFAPLAPVARAHGGLLARADETVRALLADPRDIVPLHGDIHHENVLDFGARGWLAIDPHAILGERGFDYANLFCNPDLGDPSLHVGRDRSRFRQRLEIATAHSGIERPRLLAWILAWCALSAAWLINDAQNAEVDLAIAALAAAEMTA